MKGFSTAVAFLCITFLATLVYVDHSIGLDVIIGTVTPRSNISAEPPVEPLAPQGETGNSLDNTVSETDSGLDVILFEPEVCDVESDHFCEENVPQEVSEPKTGSEQSDTFQEYRIVYENARILLSNRALILPQLELVEFTEMFSVEAPMEDATLFNISEIRTTGIMTASGRAVAGVEVLAVHSERTKYEAHLTIVLSPPEIRQVYLDRVFGFRYDGSSLLTASQRLNNANTAYSQCLELFYNEVRQRALRDGILERCRSNADRFIREVESLSSEDFMVTVHLEWSDRESAPWQTPPIRVEEGSCQEMPLNLVKS